jgi:hypothetical protein
VLTPRPARPATALTLTRRQRNAALKKARKTTRRRG